MIVEANKVLLDKHSDDSFWKFCGGRVEDFESDLKESAKREAKEELGIGLEILDDQPYFFYTEKEKDGAKISVILVHFLAKRIGEILPGKDIVEWKWIDCENLDKESLAPNIKPVLEHFGYLNKK